MRNLKRALSLALASVMLLGMMVVGAGAASYPDVDDNDNVEAIDVLNAVNVMIGRQGNFEPDEAVNRHEMAVIMAKLVLGVETADNYVGTHPFTDVVPWADKYVAACYENGLVAGTSATTFGGGSPLTAVQAAAMMLRALGYKDLSKDAKDWRAPVTAMANQIRLFNGVASIPSEQLNRNQVAQLALNTLKSSVVDLKDNTISFSDDSGKIIVSGGSREYIVRSSYESYARAINNTEIAGTSASSVSGYTVELGEHLYNGKLRLDNDVDAFGRPSRVWEYDGKDVGTYVREDLLRDEYTVKVKGSDVYDDLGTVSIRDSELLVYIDGVESTKIVKNHLARSWREDLFGTGKGVLTQVFYDHESKTITITEINTYLAKATSDYNEKTDRGTLDVYGYSYTNKEKWVRKDDGATPPKQVNTIAPYTNISSDDVAEVVNLKDGDFVLVTIADNELQSIEAPEIIQDQKISSLKVADWVNTGSQKYEFASAYDYDFEHVLTNWDITNMEDASYNLYFDNYGYVVGADLYEGAKNYVFITGYDRNGSNIYDSTVTASAIFADGTQKTIKVDAKKSDPSKGGTTWNTDTYTTDAQRWSDPDYGEGVIVNKWYTYSLNGDVYTLKLTNQLWDDGTLHGGDINAARNGLVGAYRKTLTDGATPTPHTTTNSVDIPANYYRTGSAAVTNLTDNNWAYGDTDTNYIIIDPVDGVEKMARNGGTQKWGITDVNTTITGVRNVDIDIFTSGGALKPANTDTYGAYAVYDSNRHIVAAVVIGVDTGNNDNYVYVTKGTPNEEAIRSDNAGNWYWQFDVITKEDGLTTKTVKGAYNELDSIFGRSGRKGLYRVSYDKDGYITKADEMAVDTLADYNANAVTYTGWQTNPDNVRTASNPDNIVYAVSGDTLATLGWATASHLYASGRTLNSTEAGIMRGVHLAPNAKIYNVLRINDGWDVQEYSNLASAVSALTYNGTLAGGAYDATRKDVYALLNDNGEAEILVMEVMRNYQTSQQGDYGTEGVLEITGLSFGASGARVNYRNNSGVYITSADTAIVTITGDNGRLIYTGNSTAMTSTLNGGEGYVTFGYYVGIPTSGNKYTVEMTITQGTNKYTGKATLDRS